MQKVGIEYAESGMVLAEDLVDKNGAVLLPKGSALDEETLIRVLKDGKPCSVFVQDAVNIKALMEDSIKDVSEEIKSQVEYDFSRLPEVEFYELLKLLAIKYRSKINAPEN